MINIHISTLIYRPVKQVFDFVSTPENDFQWQYGTLETARLSGGISNIGSFFRTIGHMMGRRVLSTFEVTDYEPNQKYGFRSLSGPLNSQITYTFELVNSSTKVSISTQTSIVDFFQMDEIILEKKMKKQLKENLSLLKDILETKRILPIPEFNARAG